MSNTILCYQITQKFIKLSKKTKILFNKLTVDKYCDIIYIIDLCSKMWFDVLIYSKYEFVLIL